MRATEVTLRQAWSWKQTAGEWVKSGALRCGHWHNVQPCNRVRRCLRHGACRARTAGRGSEDSCERRCSAPVCPVTTLTLSEHFYINCLAAVYFADCRFVPTGSTPSSMRVLRNGHKIRPTEYMVTAMIAVQCYGSRLWYWYGCSFSLTLGTLNWEFYGWWTLLFFLTSRTCNHFLRAAVLLDELLTLQCSLSSRIKSPSMVHCCFKGL